MVNLSITNTTVINPGKGRKENVDVLITDGVIQSVGGQKAQSKYKIINGAGKFMIPGLFDMHVHFHDGSHASLFLLNGVTSVRDVGNETSDVYELREKSKNSDSLMPRLYTAGPILEGDPPLWGDAFKVVKTPAKAIKAVNELNAKKVDFIKLYHTLSREVYIAALKRALELGLKVTSHVPNSLTTQEAIELGQTGFEHMFNMRQLAYDHDWSTKKDGGSNLKLELNRKTIKWLATTKNAIYVCPTLIVGERNYNLNTNKGAYVNYSRNTPGLEYISAELKRQWSAKYLKSIDKRSWWRANYKKIHSAEKELVSKIKNSVIILAGSDTENPFVVPGFSLIEELKLLNIAGLTSDEVLSAATISGAEYLGVQDTYGSIEAGKAADAVILSSDPTVNLNALDEPEAVIKGGRYFSRQELQKAAKLIAV